MRESGSARWKGRREKRKVNVGTCGRVEETMVTKKFILGGIIFLLSIFSIHLDPVNHPVLHVGIQEMFCEVGGWVNLSEKCSQFFHPL